MTDLHKIQMLILRELLFNPNSKFSELNISGVTSDHFSYHINTLLKDGYITKEDQKYSLTTKGKEYANQMDTDVAVIEKQPKIAVMIVAKREEDGKQYLLVQERTKEPYFGYSGFITGKIRFGEKILETAQRELKEESGLECTNIHVKRLVHDHVALEETGELLEDKMFFLVTAIDPVGEIVDTECGKNKWITVEEFFALERKYYNEENIYRYSEEKEDMKLEENLFFVKDF